MFESGDVQRLTLPGVLSAFLLLGITSGANGVAAASLGASAVALPFSRSSLAQNAEPDVDATAQETPPVEGEALAEDDVPFSELNEALTTARSRLAELTKAAEIAKVASELREQLQATEAENRQLKSVLSQLQTENSELQSARQTATSEIIELEKASEAASAEAKRLDEELVSIRWQNSQLSTSLARAETTARENADELQKVRNELSARSESLTAAADQSAAEIARLQRELDTAQGQILIAERQRAESAAELAELKQTTEDSTADSARLARDLDGTITELAASRTELSVKEEALEEMAIALESTSNEAGILREQLNSSRSEADSLRGRLETAETDLESFRSLNAGLEQQVETLRAAAGEATDAARQNLLAVENRINEINAALASVKAESLSPDQNGPGLGGPALDEPATGDERASPSAPTANDARQVARAADDDGGWVPRPSPPRASLLGEVAADAPQPASATNQPPAGQASRAPEPKETNDRARAINLASLTTDLPASRRQDAAALLGKLKAEKDARGLSMTVPGELLFAVNSEQIEPAAFDALESVAALVDLFEQHNVLIVGHTDAVGDAGYNQELSERRAALVKQFFIDQFEISADRLQVEGRGEQDPINSNATADGRNANRRVEVVILD